MRLETFFEKFDQFADAPGAVAKMREIVLELAVRGKLDQGSFVDQKHWSAKRLKELTCKIGSGSTPYGGKHSYHLNGTPLIRSMNVHFRKFVREGLAFIDDVQASALNNVIVEPNDVLLNITGASIGRVTTAPVDMAGARVNQHVAIIRTKHDLLPRFLEIILASPTFQSLIDGIQVGATREALTKRMIEEFEIPLPAASEQISVISRVDELMALCDRLEAQQKERERQHTALSYAAIARFDEAPTPANLNLLFHPSYSVNPTDVRRAVLDLAVRGKLTAQNPDDTPAITTFRKLADFAIEEDELPAQWMLVPLGKMGKWRGGGTPSKSNSEFWAGEIPWISPKDMKVLRISDGEDHISEKAVQSSSVRLIPTGSVLMVVRGMILARAFPVALTLREVTINQDMKSLHPSEPELRDFLLIALRALEPKILSAIERSSHGTCKLRTEVLESILIPIPPLSEQRRIAAKVDQLMTLIDQLESQLAASGKAANELLDAVVHKLLHPAADIIEFPRSESDRASQRAAVGCYAIEQLLRNPSFGRVMLMKACYLAETHLGLPLGWQPMRQAAGPWDPWIEDFESLGSHGEWFTVTEKALNNGHSKIEYAAKKALKTKAIEAVPVLGTQKVEFDRLLDLFADRSTEDAEIITTLFAAWNDFLIDGNTPTDDEIIREVRENWHQSKGRFAPALLQRWLRWMRSHDLTPKGHGPRTRQQLTLGLG